MKIQIVIPEEFEYDFYSDYFYDCLMRLYCDAHSLAGRYEKEFVSMLVYAFRHCDVILQNNNCLKKKEEDRGERAK
jgi:hypothetical protein